MVKAIWAEQSMEKVMVGGSPSEKPKDKTELEQATFTDSQRLYTALAEQLNLLGQTLQSLGNTPDPYQTRAVTQGFEDSSALLRDFAVKGTVKSTYRFTKGLGFSASSPRELNSPQPEKGSRDNDDAGNSFKSGAMAMGPPPLAMDDDGNGFKIALPLDEVAVDQDLAIVDALKLQEKSPREQDPEKAEEPMMGTKSVASFSSKPSKTSLAQDAECEDEGVMPGWRLKLRCVLQWAWFEPLLGVVILINSVAIGISTVASHNGEEQPFFIVVMEYFFSLVYFSELAMRLLAFGCKVLRSSWVQFDAFIVGTMIIDMIVSHLPDRLMYGSDGNTDFLKTITVVRLCRIARLARVLRLLGLVQTLWLMIEGLMSSAKTLLWAAVILTVILYIFAILGMEVIQVDPEAGDLYNETVEYYFPDFWTTAMTMFLLGLTFDDGGVIYRGIVSEKPYIFFYFVLLFAVVSIALMNLTVTLMMAGQDEQAHADEVAKQEQALEDKRNTLTDLATVFRHLDKDGSGNVDKAELEGGPPEIYQKMCEIIGKTDPHEIIRIFEMLDYDNSGELTIEEFCQGLFQMISGEPLELNILIKQCKDIRLMVEGKGTDRAGFSLKA